MSYAKRVLGHNTSNTTLDTKQTRVVKKTVPTDSFFNFFDPPKAPGNDDEEDVASDVEEHLELDYQLGEDIKEKLIPRAIDWFTKTKEAKLTLGYPACVSAFQQALQFEELDEDLEEGDFEDEEDEEDDDASEDRDDYEELDEEVRCLPTSTYNPANEPIRMKI